jgi:hypothetical protein
LAKQDFTQALVRVTEALKTEGFGILTEIDVQATMKAKLGIDAACPTGSSAPATRRWPTVHFPPSPTSGCSCLAT